MKTLLIDNYDSFTYNLCHYLAEINGEAPLVVRNDALTWQEVANMNVDNIVISPGPGTVETPADFGICADIILRVDIPILGVCLGHQGIGRCFGARIKLAPQPMHGRLSRIFHDGTDLFRDIPSPFQAVRYHSLVVEAPLPEMLRQTASTSDGILMALAHRSKPLWGVQFHPESICTEYGYALLRNFRDLSRARGRARSPPPRPVRLPGAPGQDPCATDVPAPSGLTNGASREAPVHNASYTVDYRALPRFVDPAAAFRQCFGTSPNAYWLHSALIQPGLSRFSFMGDSSGPDSHVISYQSAARRIEISRGPHAVEVNESIFDYLSRQRLSGVETPPGLPFDFCGGYVGYFGYELKSECGAGSRHQSTVPDSMLIFADRFIAFDHLTDITYLVALVPTGASSPDAWFKTMRGRLEHLETAGSRFPTGIREPINFSLRSNRDDYMAQIAQALAAIRSGESYEVCLTNELSANVDVDPLDLYLRLQQVNPAPFSAFLRFPNLAVVSSSPERFMSIDRSGRIEAKPIKGTTRRGRDFTEDTNLSSQLQNDEKNRSENLMIVDLMRNDLARVCEVGSVKVAASMHVESYATVHQLVSTIVGVRSKDCSTVDCIRAAFPGGSMTGAPKIRTMEIIDRLETGPRGIYSGALGYLSPNGAADLSIVIRTIVVTPGRLSIGVGGAVVALSDPEAEFEEMLLKAKAPLAAVPGVAIIDSPVEFATPETQYLSADTTSVEAEAGATAAAEG